MSKGDNARIHEQMAREELIKRIELRDNALVLYLGAVGAIFGFFGGGKLGLEVLMLIPYFAFGATTIIEHHHVMIGLIGHYLAVELDAAYKKMKNNFVTQWDGSNSINYRIGKYPTLLQRKYAHLTLILTPSILALLLNFKYFCAKDTLTIAWWAGAILTIITFLMILQSSNYRKELYDQYPKS